MAASVYGGSPGHHSRMINYSNGPSNANNHQLMPANLSHPARSSSSSSYYPHYRLHQHPQNVSSLQHSVAFNIEQTKSNVFLAPMPSHISSVQPKMVQQQSQQQFNSLPTSISSNYQMSFPQTPKKMRQKYNYPPNSSRNMAIVGNNIHYTCHAKRKSAVELLAESKAYYVKSEVLLDKKHLNYYEGNTTLEAVTNLSPLSTPICSISPSQFFPHQRSQTLNNTRSTSANSELLQMKLRRLLNDSTATREVKFNAYGDSIHNNYIAAAPKQFSTSQAKRSNPGLTITVADESNIDYPLMFSGTFLSPQSLSAHDNISDDYTYDYCDEKNSSTFMNDFHTISPPAEYAEFSNFPIMDEKIKRYRRYRNYQRSCSNSQAVDVEEQDYTSPTNSKNSHKSLPDLHKHTNSRHSPTLPSSTALSQYSCGNRSNKSGSSLNRDSGGSSGHYTHRSEPCAKQQQQKQYFNVMQLSPDPKNQRDSGSSTQHSNSSYDDYTSEAINQHDGTDCDVNCLLNFTTTEVPEAFQDDYGDNEYNKPKPCLYEPNSRSTLYSKSTNIIEIANLQDQLRVVANKNLGFIDGEISPPLGTFRRQKCLRLKQHPSRHASPSDRASDTCDDRKPILRSKSDVSRRYCDRNVQTSDSGYLEGSNPPISGLQRSKSENLHKLERFFERLGMNEEKYDDFIASTRLNSNSSSPIFFSDVSTVDSNRLPDSTESQPAIQPYRQMGPTSVVERNARIIKWLCTCRKLQAVA